MSACLLTFDVEDWFQVENLRSTFPPASWDAQPRRVADSTRVILDALADHGVRSTFFVLGWVGEREPALVREIAARGHEVACHGHGHVMPMQLSPAAFREDLLRAKSVLEDLSGRPVVGYRAPSFSLDRERLDIVSDCGFVYDSSHHPFGLHDRYGRLGDLGPAVVPGVFRPNGIFELGLPVERFGPLSLPASGGGYFRLYPGAVFRYLVRRSIARQGHYVLYLHSWEFDPGQPRVRSVAPSLAFRHYVNLRRTAGRLDALIAMLKRAAAGTFVTAREFTESLAGRA